MARSRKSAELLPESNPRAGLDVAVFLSAAAPVLELLTDDLLARADESPAVDAAMRSRYRDEKAQQRTADPYETWKRGVVVQLAAAWLLSCVFVRTLEDRGMLARHRLAGPGALDAQQAFTQIAPHLGMREYLLTIFAELEHFPAARPLFARNHDLAWRLMPSQEGARALVELFRTPDAERPHFRFGQPSTRFLGDLYQDLSEDVRKRYALLQTPDFVEEFILDRTLEPAIATFGVHDTSLIDPTCGSGHFLLGAFERLCGHWAKREPNAEQADHVARALAAVVGVDVNPYAVFIARFRLILAALEKLDIQALADAPELEPRVVVADSLLHGMTQGQAGFGDMLETSAAAWQGHAFALEDEIGAKTALRGGYAAVVGNPPYITVKDAALRDLYREKYSAAYREYSLSVPFMQRFFGLARAGGFVGQITANSFMKREFGKKLIEEYLPTVDLQLIVNTSGAFIPGHGTPTVMLFGRSRAPAGDKVGAVLARRGEPATPEDPAKGLVWSSIREHWGDVGYEDEYVTVAEVERGGLSGHPWSLEGGGAGELKQWLEDRADKLLQDLVEEIGLGAVTREDEVYLVGEGCLRRNNIPASLTRPLVAGEDLRDWGCTLPVVALWPYDPADMQSLRDGASFVVERFLWAYRWLLRERVAFGKSQQERGLPWYEYSMFFRKRFESRFRIAFAFVATHNHFVLDRGGKVFKQSAPIIKLPESATEDDHLTLLAYLNSSTACFWMKQVFYPKATTTGDISTEKGRPEANRYEFAGTGLKPLPIPPLTSELRTRLIDLARAISTLTAELQALDGRAALPAIAADGIRALTAIQQRRDALQQRAVALQEQIDWHIYRAFELVAHEVELPDSLAPDERWFVTKDAARWPALARAVAGSAGIRTIEDPVFKRLWLGRQGVFGHGTRSLREEAGDAAQAESLEAAERLFESPTVLALAVLQRELERDASRMRVLAELDLDLGAALFDAESVPFLAAQRFTESGLDKHAAWRRTWELQRREDAGEKVGDIPVPPKYDQKDFRDATDWRLRGKLDVPKERFIAYPGLESDEGEPLYGWAGWNHAQRAEALLALYNERSADGWTSERLIPILVGIHELLPWLRQWHDEPDPDTGERLGEAYADWLAEEMRVHKQTAADLEAWRPAKKAAKKASKKAAEPVVADTEPKTSKKAGKKSAKASAEPPAASSTDAASSTSGKKTSKKKAGKKASKSAD